MTSAAAVAAVRAIRYACGVEARIKWVNDIYLDGRKVAGILAESFALDGHAFAVVGLGINISTREFPEELRDRAGSIRADGCADVRSSLAASFASELWSLVRALPELSFMDEYRASSAVLGCEVVFTENGREYTGVAESVDDVGALTVRLSEGGTRVLRSGEISLRTV